jgi:cytoskeleton protein RodZ
MTDADAGSTELAGSPGSRLRQAREAHGLTEQQAAESLNLDPTVIIGLESNDFAALGAAVFVRGHLRRYAGFLGLPEDDLVAAYEQSNRNVAEPTLVPRARLAMDPVRSRPRWPWVVGGSAAFLLAAFLVAWLSEHDLPGAPPESDDTPDATPVASATSETVPPGETGQPPGEATASNLESTESTPSDAMPPATAPTEVAPDNAPATLPRADKSEPAPRPVAAAPAPTKPATAASPVVPAKSGRVRLQLRFSADSWVEVFDGSGKAVVYDLAKAGSERTVTVSPPLSVTLGTPRAVVMTVNGREVATPRPADGGAMARFRISGDGSVH